MYVYCCGVFCFVFFIHQLNPHFVFEVLDWLLENSRSILFDFVAYGFTYSCFRCLFVVFFLFNALKLHSLLYFISSTAISLRYHCTQYSFLFSFKVRNDFFQREFNHTHITYDICLCTLYANAIIYFLIFYLKSRFIYIKPDFFILFPNKSHQKQ